MAITDVNLSGKVRADDGSGVSGASVTIHETASGLDGSQEGSAVTTNSDGTWSFTEQTLTENYDVKITSAGGGQVRYIPWSDEITLKTVDTSVMKVRGATNTAAAPIYLLADLATDAGDAWRIQATDSDTLAIGSDKASAGTIIDYITITNGANAAASNTTILGQLTIGVDDTGADVKFFGATAGSFLLWDESDDALELTDSSPIKIGDGGDMTIYHDGSHSYITNATGALKLATETSGIAVTIGHTTSEVTIADNLTVTGTLTLGSNAELTEAELELLDGITAGTAIASKVVTTDANIDTSGQRNLTITGELDAATLDISGNADIDGTTNLDAVDIDGAVQIDATFTSGVDGQGYDTKFFGDTSGAYILWDTSADKLLTAGGAVVDIVKDKLLIGGTAVTTTAAELNVLDAVTAGTVAASLGVVVDSNKDIGSFRNITLTGELDAGSLDVSGNADIDGTTNLDAVDIDGAVQIDGTVTVGVDDTGLDVKFFGATSGNYALWDESTDDLILAGSSELYFYDAAGGEHIKSDGTDMTIYAGTDLNLTAGTDINIPANVGLTFGNDGEKIEGDGTDLTISGNKIKLSPASTEDVLVANDTGLIVGHTSALTAGGSVKAKFQVLGTATYEASMLLANFQNNDNGPLIIGVASNNTSIAAGAIVTDNQVALELRGAVDDGSGDLESQIAKISMQVDGTPGADDSPGRIVFSTTAGSAATVSERLRIDSSGAIGIGGATYGDAGQQITSGGSGAAVSWGAGSSRREDKDIIGPASSEEALQAILNSKAYNFRYKDKKGTGDTSTNYVGLMADEAPWAMHYNGTIVNPVNTLGYTVLAFQEMERQVEDLKERLAAIGG